MNLIIMAGMWKEIFLSWNYDVYEACSAVIHITKEPLHWGDTYVIDFLDSKDELMGLMLVLAIDADKL